VKANYVTKKTQRRSIGRILRHHSQARPTSPASRQSKNSSRACHSCLRMVEAFHDLMFRLARLRRRGGASRRAPIFLRSAHGLRGGHATRCLRTTTLLARSPILHPQLAAKLGTRHCGGDHSGCRGSAAPWSPSQCATLCFAPRTDLCRRVASAAITACRSASSAASGNRGGC